MSGEVLVLNRSFYAICITSWQRALSLVYLDHASIVDEEYRTYSFEDWMQFSTMMQNSPSGFVRTPTFKIAIPEVIALKCYDRLPTTEVKFTRRNIYEHYGYRCCYCGNKFPAAELNLEHVIPKSRGGKTSWCNVVTSCIPCNVMKGNRLPDEAGMKLLTKPSKPRWRGSMALMFHSPLKIRSSWQRFIDTMYWNGELERE